MTVTGGSTPYEYLWTFGDGETGQTEEGEVDHVYGEPGSYNVTVTVTDDTGDAVTSQPTVVAIEANGEPTVAITADPDMGLAPMLVQFESTVTGGDGDLTYEWDFGDGETDVTPNPRHLYDTAGTYDATLTVNDEDGDTAQATVTVAVGSDDVPAAAVTADPVEGSAPLLVSFTCDATGGNEPLSYAWDFGDDRTSNIQNPQHTYTESGAFAATCVVTDENGDTSADSVTVTVGTNELPDAIASATPVEGIVPLEVHFTGRAVGGDGDIDYAWDYGTGDTSDVQSPTYTFTAPGSYRVLLTVTDSDGDFDTDLVTVTVREPEDLIPTAVASGSPRRGEAPLEVRFEGRTLSGDAPITYRWELGTGEGSDEQNPTYTYGAPGIYEAVLVVTDNDGDVDVATVEIEVLPTPNEPPTVEALVTSVEPAADTACAVTDQTEVHLEATGADVDDPTESLTYHWSLIEVPPGAPVYLEPSEIRNPTFTPTDDGTYVIRVTVTDPHGLTGYDEVIITSEHATVLNYVAGREQTAQAGERYGDMLEVQALTQCGLVAEGVRINWAASNGSVRSYSTADEEGIASTNATAGTVAGEDAVFTATLNEEPDVSIDFVLAVTPNDPAAIVIDEVDDVAVTNAACDLQDQVVTVRVTDEYGNEVGAEVEFELLMDAGEGTSFDVGSVTAGTVLDSCCAPTIQQLTARTSAGGVFTVAAQSTEAGPVTYAIGEITTPDITIGTMYDTVFEDDFETARPDWTFEGDWERDEPVLDDEPTARSGSYVVATTIGGDYTYEPYDYGFAMLENSFGFSSGDEYIVEWYQWSRMHQWERYGSMIDGAVSTFSPWGPGDSWWPVEPEYDGDYYYEGWGTHESWRRHRAFIEVYLYGPYEGFFWSLENYRPEEGSDLGVYIDDVRILVRTLVREARFLGGEPTTLTVTETRPGLLPLAGGDDCLTERFEAELFDCLGQLSGDSTTEISCTITPADSGASFLDGEVTGTRTASNGTAIFEVHASTEGIPGLMFDVGCSTDGGLTAGTMTGMFTPDDDLDGDGFTSCVAPIDCDPENGEVNPGAEELCDGLDTDCDGLLPDDELEDRDGDGWVDCMDCEHYARWPELIHPGWESEGVADSYYEDPCADDYDNDCNGLVDCEDPGCSDREWCASCLPDQLECWEIFQCIEEWQWCDGEIDCDDATDEWDCGCDFMCGDGTCIEAWQWCNGEMDCPDGEDEMDCGGCEPGFFPCYESGGCVDASWVCDMEPDCGGGEDEMSCGDCGMGSWMCMDSMECVPALVVCDGRIDCADESDEMLCPPPPLPV